MFCLDYVNDFCTNLMALLLLAKVAFERLFGPPKILSCLPRDKNIRETQHIRCHFRDDGRPVAVKSKFTCQTRRAGPHA